MLIQYGLVCKHCVPGRCVSCPNDVETIEVDCPECEQRGCDFCNGDGRHEYASCPQEHTREVAPLLPLVSLFEKGLPPVAGGALDQDHWFLEACQYLWSEHARVRSFIEKRASK